MTAYVSIQTPNGPMWVFQCSDFDQAEDVMRHARRVDGSVAVGWHVTRPVASPKRRVYYLDAEALPRWFGGGR